MLYLWNRKKATHENYACQDAKIVSRESPRKSAKMTNIGTERNQNVKTMEKIGEKDLGRARVVEKVQKRRGPKKLKKTPF